MSVLCKFKVVGKHDHQTYNDGHEDITPVEVALYPVFESNGEQGEQACEENRIFGKATPSGHMYMQLTNPEAASQFNIGDEFYITLETKEEFTARMSPAPVDPEK